MEDAAINHTAILNTVIKVLLEIDHFDRANKIVAEIKDHLLQAPALSLLAEYQAKTGDFTKAKSITDRILDNRIKVESLMSIAQHAIQAKKMSIARESTDLSLLIAQTVRPDRIKVQLLCSLSQLMVQYNEYERAVTIAKRAQSIAQAMQDSQILINVVRTMALAKQVNLANQISAQINDKAAQANAFCKIAQVALQANKTAEAREITNNALSIALDCKDGVNKVLALGYVQQIIVEMKDQKMAQSVTNNLVDFAEQIDNDPTVLGCVSQSLTRIGKFKEASEIIDRIPEQFREWEMIDVLQIRAEMGYGQDAKELVESFRGTDTKINAWCAIAQAMLNLGDEESATKLIKEAFHDLEIMQDERMKAVLLSRMMKLSPQLLDVNTVSRAKSMAEAFTDKTIAVRTLSSIATAFAMLNQRSQALEIATLVWLKTQELGRTLLLQVLDDTVVVLVNPETPNPTQALWQLYNILDDIDSWWESDNIQNILTTESSEKK